MSPSVQIQSILVVFAAAGADALPAWSAWGEWGGCGALSCGPNVGLRVRERACPPSARPPCPGPASQTLACPFRVCPLGQWSSWGDWSPCSATCGVGAQRRRRLCPKDHFCPGLDSVLKECRHRSKFLIFRDFCLVDGVFIR